MIILLFLMLLGGPQEKVLWPKDTHVQVYFQEGFSPSQREAAMRGIASWQNTGGISATVAGDTKESLTCAGCLTFRRANLTDKREAGQLSAWRITPPWIAYAWVDVDFRSQSDEILEAVSCHEFGHQLGLRDAGGKVQVFGLYRSGSILDAFSDWNHPSRLKPSAEDLKNARANYPQP